ncbi:thioredoxin family protein [Glaciecola siphonariae]|uniref:Thioredoxin family protein n=1 Tax=Glaciecola siphonariae TaxID=521012 RepID=A0ABV9LT88_9ALTE
MSLTQSTMLALGSPAHDFCLMSTEDQPVSLSDFAHNDLLVVMFICNHCPYVIHIAPALAKIAREYQDKGVGFIAINSNDTQAYPEDSFEKMKSEKANRDYPFAYVIDETQEVAKAYTAACTPDMYVFNAQRKLAYRGQFDSTRPHRISSGNYDASNGQANGEDLRQALDTLLAGKSLTAPQKPSMGCNIKWKPEQE